MGSSRIQMFRCLAVMVVALVPMVLGLALMSAGAGVPAAFGYAPGPGGQAVPIFLPLVLRNGLAEEAAGEAATPVVRDEPADGDADGTRSLMALAATVDVACADVSGLIAAINTANGNGEDDVVNLNSNDVAGCTYPLVSGDNDTDGSNGLPSILSDGGHRLTINGNGATIERSSALPFRIFHVSSGGDLTLNNLTITNGLTSLIEGQAGGGIYNAGTLTLNDSAVTGNATGHGDGDGGGIYNEGTLTLNETTISHNSTAAGDDTAGTDAGDGGGIYNAAGAHLTLTSSTVSSNSTGVD